MVSHEIEDLTQQFYDWENWGCGRKLFDFPVELEPPFTPFFYHKRSTEYIDDGNHLSIFQKIGSIFKKRAVSKDSINTEDTITPFEFSDNSELRAIAISLPRSEKVQIKEMEQVLTMLSFTDSLLSFEIIANRSLIRIQFVCRESDVLHVSSQLKAFFPRLGIHDKTEEIWNILPSNLESYVYELAFAEEFMRPIAVLKNFTNDPFVGLFGLFDIIKFQEQIAIQILFQGVINPWPDSILRSISDDKGGDFFLDCPEMKPFAKEKIASPLFGVAIRVIGSGNSSENSFGLANQIVKTISQISKADSNKLVPVSNQRINTEHLANDILNRESHRLGMLMNAKELATLVHLPSESIASDRLERTLKRTKELPKLFLEKEFILGSNLHQGNSVPAYVSNLQRLKHTHIIGATGTGKSTFLLSQIVSDIKLGNGIAVLDPHGDLIENILPYISENRIKDVIIIDPSDTQFPVGFNILTAHSDIEKEILSADLVAAFKRFSTSWGDQMNSVFANAILAFLENEKGGTLFDLRRFLIEKEFRSAFLKDVTDPSIVYYWQKEYPLLKTNSIGSILTRLDTFLRPKLIRNMVVQPKSIDFESILNSRKILLIKLSHGLIGSENSYLLGTFIVSKIHQAAMARQAISKSERSNFFLYIDEFQNFITPSMASILSGARKYNLGLILAHQDMQQLIKQDNELASSVIANAGTRICFRLGDLDAKRFEDGFSFFSANDLQNLETGEAIVRIDRPEFDFNLRIDQLPELDSESRDSLSEQIIAQSREKYGTSLSEVEKYLSKLHESVYVLTHKEEQKWNNVYETIHKSEALPASESQSNDVINALVKQKKLTEHRYLQSYIKRMAEQRGYKAHIEELTPDGCGRVDVSLERNGFRIACEVAMTTTDNWEVHNIEKCIAAGYDLIVECSSEKKVLDKIKIAVNEKIHNSFHSKILILEPESLFMYLDSRAASEASTESRVKGYRVKVKYNPETVDDNQRKKEVVTRILKESERKSANK